MMEDAQVAPATRTAHVQWHPNPLFYDQRGALVAALDGAFGVERFHIGDHQVDVVLDSGFDLKVEAGGLIAFGPVRRRSKASHVAEIAVAVLQSLDATPWQVWFAFQHILPWPDSASLERAYAMAIDATLKAGTRERFRFSDMALLVDGERENGGRYQVEFGVIDKVQAPLRLLRKVGRVTGLQPSSHEHIWSIDFPDVSTFCDSTWMTKVESEAVGHIDSWVKSLLAESEQEANELAIALHQQVTEESATKGSHA